MSGAFRNSASGSNGEQQRRQRGDAMRHKTAQTQRSPAIGASGVLPPRASKCQRVDKQKTAARRDTRHHTPDLPMWQNKYLQATASEIRLARVVQLMILQNAENGLGELTRSHTLWVKRRNCCAWEVRAPDESETEKSKKKRKNFRRCFTRAAVPGKRTQQHNTHLKCNFFEKIACRLRRTRVKWLNVFILFRRRR